MSSYLDRFYSEAFCGGIDQQFKLHQSFNQTFSHNSSANSCFNHLLQLAELPVFKTQIKADKHCLK